MIYLYVKTHNKTGLKYLGKTEQNPYNYKGSGKYWKLHLKKHGDDITTEVIFVTEELEEFREIALYYSKLWDIVKSDQWANLREENGDGGFDQHTEETKKKISLKLMGNSYGKCPKPSLIGHKNCCGPRPHMKGNQNAKGAVRSEETRRKISEKKRYRDSLKQLGDILCLKNL